MSNAAIVVPSQPEYRGLTLTVNAAEAKARQNELAAFVLSAMVEGVDFGTLPSVSKKVLFQPGAQKLAELYGLATDFVDVEVLNDWEKPFFFYRKKVIITARRDGRYIGSGVGSCNSLEDRYAWRWVFDNALPAGMKKEQLKSRTGVGKNGRAYTQFRMPNEDLYTLVNTIEKMACKRALVMGIVSVTQSAGIFTQDPEALAASVPEEAYGVPDDRRSWEQGDANAPAAPAGPTDAQVAEYNRLVSGITAADSVDALKPWSKSADESLRAQKITVEQIDAIANVFNERKQHLKARKGGPEAAP